MKTRTINWKKLYFSEQKTKRQMPRALGDLIRGYSKWPFKKYCHSCRQNSDLTVSDHTYTKDFKKRVYYCKKCGKYINHTVLPTWIYHYENGDRIGVVV